MNKRKFTYKDYNMTPARRRELVAFCEQYQEWKDELLYNKDTVHSTGFNGMPFSKTNNKSDPTADLAMRHAALQQKIDLIENTAKEVDADLWKFIIKFVCDRDCSYAYLRGVMGVPCSQSAMNDRRRYFLALLNVRKK